MITATEALRLPSAQLTHDERKGVVALLEKIDLEVRTGMKLNGIVIATDEIRPPVNAAVMQTLIRAGWNVAFHPIVVQSKVAGSKPYHTGFNMELTPSVASFKNDNTLQ